jgi:hypothetical protein
MQRDRLGVSAGLEAPARALDRIGKGVRVAIPGSAREQFRGDAGDPALRGRIEPRPAAHHGIEGNEGHFVPRQQQELHAVRERQALMRRNLHVGLSIPSVRRSRLNTARATCRT